MKTVGGYGRYDDDPTHVGCPRTKSDMTPCVARDGALALSNEGDCIFCYKDPRKLLQELRHEITDRSASPVTNVRHAADKLRDLVREVTA